MATTAEKKVPQAATAGKARVVKRPKAAPDTAGRAAPLQPAPVEGGGWVVRLVSATTALFVAGTVAGLWSYTVRAVLMWYDAALFVVGTAVFLVAIVMSGTRALQGVGVRASGLYLGAFAQPRDQLVFKWSFAVMSAVGVAGALLAAPLNAMQPSLPVTGATIPALALGILAPIFPPAFAGLHGARYCPWPVRPGGKDSKATTSKKS